MMRWLAKGADETCDDQTVVYPRDLYVRDTPTAGGSNRQKDVGFERLENELIDFFVFLSENCV